MATYKVKAHFNMGMSEGSGTYTFKAKNVRAAKQHLRRHSGRDLSIMKRNVRFDKDTLSRTH